MKPTKISVTIIAIALVISSNFVFASWNSPTLAPPEGNTDVPINQSAASQVKAGGLGLGSLLVSGNSIFDGIFSMKEQTSAPTSQSGYGKLYWKTDHKLYQMNNAGTETELGSADLVSDPTPQLGGNLDINGNTIVSLSNGNIDLAPNGTGKARVGTDEIVTLSANQTISNKTMISPTINSATVNDATFNNPNFQSINGFQADNNMYMKWRNAADDNFIDAIKVDSSDRVVLANGNMVIATGGSVGVGTDTPTSPLDVRGKMRIDQSPSYDVWIQGGSATTGNDRNLAMVGTKSNDTLYINHSNEYTGGVRFSHSWIRDANLAHNSCSWTSNISNTSGSGYCSDGFYVAGLNTYHSESSGGYTRLYCCRP